MKTHILLAMTMLFIASTTAQRNVEKVEAVSTGQDIFLNFQFAQDIQVEQWNKNEVVVKASVNIDEGEGNNDFSLKTENSSGRLKIASDFGDYFKKNRNRNNCYNNTEINYTVYIPKGANLKVKSISGSVAADSFIGNLTTDLISGNVTIKNYDGALKLKTISGDVDVTMNKAKINASTLTGTIYSDLDINKDEHRNSTGSNKIIGTINNGNELIVMETISGNIYMRKG